MGLDVFGVVQVQVHPVHSILAIKHRKTILPLMLKRWSFHTNKTREVLICVVDNYSLRTTF